MKKQRSSDATDRSCLIVTRTAWAPLRAASLFGDDDVVHPQDGHRGLHGELNRPALGVVVVENTRFRCIVWRDDLGFLSLSLEKDFFLSDSTRAVRRVARCTFSQQLYVFHTPSLPKRFSVHRVFTF